MNVNRKLRWYSVRWQTLVILCLLFLAAWYVLIGRFKHTVGSGPAGPPVAVGPFNKIWSTNKFVFVGMGDSITAGFGASRRHSYFELLAENDDAIYPEMQGRDF